MQQQHLTAARQLARRNRGGGSSPAPGLLGEIAGYFRGRRALAALDTGTIRLRDTWVGWLLLSISDGEHQALKVMLLSILVGCWVDPDYGSCLF